MKYRCVAVLVRPESSTHFLLAIRPQAQQRNHCTKVSIDTFVRIQLAVALTSLRNLLPRAVLILYGMLIRTLSLVQYSQ